MPGLRAALDARRTRILERVIGLEEARTAIVRSVAVDPPDDEHDPEGATTAFERQQLAALIAAAHAELAEVGLALDRVALGTAGSCTRCGLPIRAARLEARPATATCVECARHRR